MVNWIEKWIAICPDGIVTDQVINEVLALQMEQGRCKAEPIPVTEPANEGTPGGITDPTAPGLPGGTDTDP